MFYSRGRVAVKVSRPLAMNNIDIVFYDPRMTGEEVRRSLIDHDGYRSDIVFTRQVHGRTMRVGSGEHDSDDEKVIDIEGETFWRDELSDKDLEQYDPPPEWTKEN